MFNDGVVGTVSNETEVGTMFISDFVSDFILHECRVDTDDGVWEWLVVVGNRTLGFWFEDGVTESKDDEVEDDNTDIEWFWCKDDCDNGK